MPAVSISRFRPSLFPRIAPFDFPLANSRIIASFLPFRVKRSGEIPSSATSPPAGTDGRIGSGESFGPSGEGSSGREFNQIQWLNLNSINHP